MAAPRIPQLPRIARVGGARAFSQRVLLSEGAGALLLPWPPTFNGNRTPNRARCPSRFGSGRERGAAFETPPQPHGARASHHRAPAPRPPTKAPIRDQTLPQTCLGPRLRVLRSLSKCPGRPPGLRFCAGAFQPPPHSTNPDFLKRPVGRRCPFSFPAKPTPQPTMPHTALFHRTPAAGRFGLLPRTACLFANSSEKGPPRGGGGAPVSTQPRPRALRQRVWGCCRFRREGGGRGAGFAGALAARLGFCFPCTWRYRPVQTHGGPRGGGAGPSFLGRTPVRRSAAVPFSAGLTEPPTPLRPCLFAPGASGEARRRLLFLWWGTGGRRPGASP